MSGPQSAPRRMPMQRGPMGQVGGGEKARNFGPSAKRLLGTLRHDMPALTAVLIFSVLSVALTVIGIYVLIALVLNLIIDVVVGILDPATRSR